MRGGLFVFPLYVDPQEAAAADARERLHPLAAQSVATSEALNPQRMAALVRSSSSSGLGEVSETTADVLNALPKWAQAVMQSGCFNASSAGVGRSDKKRKLEQQEDRPRKRRSMRGGEAKISLEDESSELQDCLDELNASQNIEMEEKNTAPMWATQAELIADSVEKYTELLEQLLEKATNRQQSEAFERDGLDIFSQVDAKTLLQAFKAMEKSDWIRKMEPHLLISLMTALDAQVQLGLTIDIKEHLFPNDEDGSACAATLNEHLVQRLQMSLDVAIVELIVMTTSQIDRRVLSEENIDDCIQILHHVVRGLLLPCIDTTYVTSVAGRAVTEKKQRQSTGGKGSGVSRVNLRSNKAIRKAVDRIIPVICEFVDQLANLILSVKLADRWVLQLTSSMVELFALEHSSYANSLQQSGLTVLRSIFLQYKPHRGLLLEEIVGVMIKLPTAKRTLRTIKLVGSDIMVQRISTLVVSMVQSCVLVPYTDNTEVDDKKPQGIGAETPSTPDTVGEEKLQEKSDLAKALLEETRCCVRSFVRALLKECWKKNDERDNRVVLENFIEDLLVMFVRPEWAGAEDVLEVLSSSLASILNATVSKEAKKPDSHQSIAALNLVGRICAAIKKYQKEAELKALVEDGDSVAVVEEHSRLFRNDLEKVRVEIASCPHGNSGFDRLALKHIVVIHLQRNNVDHNDSKNLLLSKFICSPEFKWNNDDAELMTREKHFWESLWNIPKGATSSSYQVTAPSSELAVKASLCLAVERDFCGLFDSLFAHMMGLLVKGMSSLRARVMKSLRGIVDIDPMLMADSGVQSAVRRCCSDERITVRQAAVELVGTYIMQQPLLFDKYFEILAERLRDKGITVRKSVCRIFKIALTSMQDGSGDKDTAAQNLKRKSSCMRSLVERVGDASEDQTVKNFIIDTFQDVWFGAELSSTRLLKNEFGDDNTLPPGWTVVTAAAGFAATTPQLEVNSEVAQPAQFISNDGLVANTIEEAWNAYRTPIVAPASVVKSNLTKEDSSPEVVATIVEVINGMANLDWLVELLKRLLQERSIQTKMSGVRSSKDRSAEMKIAKNRSQKIVNGLVDTLMDLQEGKMLEGISIGDRHLQFLSCMKALLAFSEAQPSLLSRHLITIEVYLNEDDVKVKSLAVAMLNNILRVGKTSERIANKLESDLIALVWTTPPSVVKPSIKCLTTLSTARKKLPMQLLSMLEQFFLTLQKFKCRESLSGLSSKEHSSLQRALFAAGQIAGGTDIDAYPGLVKHQKVLQIGTVMDSLYDIYAKFIRMPGSTSCTIMAVQGMGYLFPVRPRLFLRAQQDGLLDLLLSAYPERVKLQCLKSLKDLLLYEEERLEKGVATQLMNKLKSKEQQVQGDQEADASLIGNVMQVQLGSVLKLSLQNPPQVRMEAVACIGALLTQGLVNPLQCIPSLVALETDRVVANRDAAHTQLASLYEKFANQFQTPSIEGIKESYAFQLKCFGNATPFALDKDKKDFCLFGRLYTAFLRPTRAQRASFLKSLVNQFTDRGSVLHPPNGKSSAKCQADLTYLCYLAQIISSLPYEVEDEPLSIIYWINRYVSLRLGPVIDDLKKIFLKAGIPEELLEDEDTNLAKVSIDEYSLTLLTGPKLDALVANGCIAFALALLLRLKFALKAMYDLEDEKCATYQPSSAINDTDFSLVPAQRSDDRKLLLPSVEDVFQSEDRLKLGWNLFVLVCPAARKDQSQLDFEAVEEAQPRKTPKRRRRSRKSATKKKLQAVEEETDEDEDEYVEGFA